MASQYYVARRGQPQREGPFTREQLEEGFRAGRFAATDLTWETGTMDWISISARLTPQTPEMPPLPEFPPLPVDSAPSTGAGVPPPPPIEDLPPPPLEDASPPPREELPPPPMDDVPPLPYYGEAPRKSSSPAGPLALILAIAGCAGVGYMVYDLDYASPVLRAHRFSENMTAIVAVAVGLLTLLVASTGMSRKFRNRSLAGFSFLLGFVLLLGGIGGLVFHAQFASLRYAWEEKTAQFDIGLMGKMSVKYADEHGGRFPDSLEELLTVPNAEMFYEVTYKEGALARQVRVTPGLRQTSPKDAVLLSDSWSTDGNTHAVYLVSGATKSLEGDGDAKAPVEADPPAGKGGFLDTPKKSAPAVGNGDYSSPEKTIQAIVTAGRAGNVAGLRRAMTPEGFQNEYAVMTPNQIAEEFRTTSARVKSKGPIVPVGNGILEMRVVIAFTDDGRTDDEEVIFQQRGGEWLLHSL